MEKWHLSGIITNDTQNKLIIPKGYLKGPGGVGMFNRLYELFRQGAEKLARVATIF